MDPRASNSICIACGTDTSSNKKQRQLLCSSSSQHVLPTLTHVLKETLSEAGYQLNEETLKYSYVCRSCFRDGYLGGCSG